MCSRNEIRSWQRRLLGKIGNFMQNDYFLLRTSLGKFIRGISSSVCRLRSNRKIARGPAEGRETLDRKRDGVEWNGAEENSRQSRHDSEV